MSTWNPWHGCKKISPGCTNCYVYRRDAEFGKDSSVVTRTSNFDMPVKCNRKGDYKLQPDGESVYTCMTTDFFLDEADVWRAEAWNIIRRRSDYRLPVFLELPIKHRTVIHEPMLEQIDIRKYLATGKIEGVTCGGESGPDARVCDFAWILDSMEQCVEYDVPFWFKQTGAMFKKGNKVYLIDRKAQMSQAQKAGVNYKC